MTEEKILKGEVLNAEELENIAGGTLTEMFEVTKAINSNWVTRYICDKVPPQSSIDKHGDNVFDFAKTVTKRLEALGIGANIKEDENNSYWDKATGAAMSHSAVLAKIAAFKG